MITDLEYSFPQVTKETRPAAAPESLYAELKRMIESHGLLQSQPLYYGYKILAAFFMIISAWAIFFLVDQPWLKILDAVYMSFATTQLSFIGHDAGHRQIFNSTRKNDLIGLLSVLFVGISYFWWVDTHNKHHSKPNQTPHDPAIDYTVLAFSTEDALRKTGLYRFIIKHQSLFFVPLMCLYPISIRIDSIRFFLQNRYPLRIAEASFLFIHFLLYFVILFSTLPVLMAILFLLIHGTLYGLYIASVFVPNHMGMVILEPSCDLDFLRHQVVTARNIKGPRILDFWFGGLNYQIEHHLFPKMPRNRLRKAKKIVEEFCRQKSIEYYETSFFQSYLEILRYLRQVSLSMR